MQADISTRITSSADSALLMHLGARDRTTPWWRVNSSEGSRRAGAGDRQVPARPERARRGIVVMLAGVLVVLL